MQKKKNRLPSAFIFSGRTWKNLGLQHIVCVCFPCRRRSPEGQTRSGRRAACRCRTGSVSRTSDLRESHPLVFPPLPRSASIARRDALKNDSLASHRPKDPVANGQSRGGSDGTKTAVCQKRALEDPEGAADTLSKNKQKKRSRNPHKNFCSEQKRESSRRLSRSRRASRQRPGCERDSLFSLPAAKYIKCEQCGNPKVGGGSISS